MGTRASAEPAQTEPRTQPSKRKKPVKRRPRAAEAAGTVRKARRRTGRKLKRESPKKAQAKTEDTRDDYTPASFIDRIIRQFQARLGEDTKATVADYIRLLQLRRELEQQEDASKEITVTWVDPPNDGPEEEA